MKIKLKDIMLHTLLIISVGVSAYALLGVKENIEDKEEIDKGMDIIEEIGKPKEVEEEKERFLKVDIESLKKKNEDIVGWMRIGGIGLDVALVQGEDNEYYLTHDIEKRENKGGWVFIDARADIEKAELNTVIYGHNLIGRQFGLLKNLLKEEVREKEGSNIIQVTTEYEERVYEIVSVYITEYDDWGYAQQQFGSEESKRKYLKNVESRNKVKEYGVEGLSSKDNYITLSTCHGTTGTEKRLVVHAREIDSRTRFEGIEG